MSRKIKGEKDLESIRCFLAEKINCRSGAMQRDGKQQQIMICTGGGCLASGSLELAKCFEQEIVSQGLAGEISIVKTGCMGPCVAGPVVKFALSGRCYQGVQIGDINELIHCECELNQPVQRILFNEGVNQQQVVDTAKKDYFQKQQKIVLRNCGVIDPLDIDEYIAADGYFALHKAVTAMEPDEILSCISKAGLRGRGGGGFPTGRKWSLASKAKGKDKVVVCNADEGDPGAFMDRSVLEGDPHSVIEGMAIAARAIGASQGYVYVRAEYPLAVERLGWAIEQAREYGLLGEDIFGFDFKFDLEIRMGSGAFVCGEETALLVSIEGQRGEPHPRPPFPAEKGLWEKPTLLNNVETFANVAPILLKGSEWFSALGTEKSKGTKVFALAGSVVNTGLVEVPIGISLGELIYDIGGGLPEGRSFKAAQIGGPSGGCIPKEHLNVPLDYESLNELGAIMGSGGLIVMSDEACMVDVARFFLEFVQEESCGKCAPCRVGTKRLLEILERICCGEGREGDIEALIELGEEIKETALCGLGKTAANPILSTIRHFRHEYVEHIRDKHCAAGVCSALVRAPCQSACPANVDIPGFVSLVSEKRYAEALRLHRERNPFAAACARVCFHTCEDHCRRSSLDAPVSIRGVKRFMVEQEVTVQIPEVRESEANAQRKIAVIGAGPAGLSCAYFLARLGYRPKVYEAQSRPGGMMAQAIPAYRLPREILAREIRMIERLGVDVETEKVLGRDFSLSGLRDQGYDAVFIALGAPETQPMGIPGEEAKGVTEALSFLRQYNTRGSVAVGQRVVVCGGGNAAVDAARTALRLGAKQVTIVYRRTREEMPAYAEEIEEAEKEGVQFMMLTSPLEVKTKEGQVSGLVCHQMKLGDFDRSGRRKPEAVAGESFVIEAEQIISAVGQRLETADIFAGMGIELDKRGYIKVDPVTGQTSQVWIFAGGDAVTGPSSVIEAVAAGERAAVGINNYLGGNIEVFWREQQPVDVFFDPDADPSGFARAEMPLIPLERRRNNFDEVELPWSEPVAVCQAKRCLRCDFGKKDCSTQ